MDERFEQLSTGTQELVNILAAGKATEFAAALKREVKKDVDSGHALEHCPPHMRDGFAQYLATVSTVAPEFIAHMHMSGFQDGFCACLRCLAICEDNDIDSFDDLLTFLKGEVAAMSPAEKFRVKMKHIRECML